VSCQHKAASFLPYQPGIEFAPKPIKITNSKHEIRNPKQIRNDEKQLQCSKQVGPNSAFWIFRILDLFDCKFVSDFDIRISDLASWNCFGPRGRFGASDFGFGFSMYG
jgi:hypothetical protein